MTSSPRAFLLAALATPALLAAQRGGAAAAPAAPACNIETMTPAPLGIAYLQRQKVVAAKTPEEAKKAIQDAMKQLFDDKNRSNVLGRDYMLAQFFVFAAEYGEVQTRGNLGMPGDKNANVDLIVGADSLFTMVEKAQPLCVSETAQWREYKPYQALVQGAYKQISANNADSAEKLVKRAQVLSKNGAQTYDVLWRVAKAHNDEAGQISNLQMAADKLIGDTLNGNVRANFLFNLGRIQQEFADKKTDKAAKVQLQRDAAKAYMTVIKEFPQSEETPFALQGISVAMTQSNDTSLAVAAVDLVNGATAKYADVTLAQAGVVATRAGKIGEAVALFDAANKVNPYSRDYAYNLAATLFTAKRSAEMLPVVKRLVALDPSNSENVMLFAYAFKGLSDAESNATAKKALIDSVNYYGKVADDMAQVHKLVYTEFDRLKDKTILAGQVENHGKVARTFTIEFEFLGKDGAVLAKQTATVANVAPNGVGDFTVEIPVGGVLGVRYAALPLK
jgi:tetratricopeptide (TPR) repeat protein